MNPFNAKPQSPWYPQSNLPQCKLPQSTFRGPRGQLRSHFPPSVTDVHLCELKMTGTLNPWIHGCTAYTSL